MARLIVVDGEASHAHVSFEQACLIGRGEPCDLLLHDATASRTHARIDRGGDGRYTLVDLDSANGTLLNGRAVTRSLLFDGDEIAIGATRMRFLGTSEGTLLHDVGWLVRRRAPLVDPDARRDESAHALAGPTLAVLQEWVGVLDEENLVPRLLAALHVHFACDLAGFVPEDATGRRHEEITYPRAESALLPAMLDEVERRDEALCLSAPRAADEPGFLTLLVAPVREGDGDRGGVLYLASREPDAFGTEHLRAVGIVATCFARQLSGARDVRRLRDELARHRLRGGAGSWVSESAAFRATLDALETHGDRDTPLFLVGEAGTGKERLARELHERSRRAACPFHALLCSPLDDDLLERELVGHERATPRGSVPLVEGLLARVGAGTLYLDALGPRSRAFQEHLGLILAERRFHPVGTDLARRHRARLVVALDAPSLDQALAALDPVLERLARPFAVFVPPLRRRREDVPKLAQRQLARLRHEAPCPVRGFTERALDALREHDWPGNLRELRTVVELAALRAPGERIDVEHLALP